MKIRNAVPGDTHAICDVLKRSITELCVADHNNNPEILQKWLSNKTPDTVSKWIAQNDSSLLVAVENDSILGVGSVSDQGEILLNYVSPDARFRGVSREMLSALEERARERGNTSCVLTSTVTAERFYHSQGYIENGEIIEPWRDGSPCYRMAKPLGNSITEKTL